MHSLRFLCQERVGCGLMREGRNDPPESGKVIGMVVCA